MACTTDQAAGWVYRILAGPGIVGVEKGAHHGAALVVTTRALAAGAGEATATRGSVVFVLVTRTGAGVARAGLGNVTGACTRTTDRVGGCKLALTAAAVVGVVADGVVLVFACRGITASIVAAVFLAATVAVFAGLDDAVAALAAANSHDSAIVGETG